MAMTTYELAVLAEEKARKRARYESLGMMHRGDTEAERTERAVAYDLAWAEYMRASAAYDRAVLQYTSEG